MTESRKTKSAPKKKKAAKKTASKAAGKLPTKPASKTVADSSAAPSSSSRAARSAAPKSLPRVIIYTDGACAPNPGLGGWAAILRSPDHGNKEREITGAESDTTNNRMELLAAVRALEALKRPCLVELHTDSEYLQKAFTQGWLDKWQRNGWRTASKKPVANDDLWRELLAAAAPHQIRWNWVRGHHEDEYNHRADELAVQARLDLAQRLKG